MFFFFSSRRRHTRCLSDWSSDVCSSDLKTVRRAMRGQLWITKKFRDGSRHHLTVTRVNKQTILAILNYLWNIADLCRDHRSEERRVGKECRSRWRMEH